MYVVPSARGRGWARRLLAALEDSARGAGADLMVLETGTAQPEAIALYESSGYEPVHGFGYYRDSPTARYFGKRL
jgi:ribosomal protein S18 acetylase RimI-like enzyme